jgi:hypothetical protein
MEFNRAFDPFRALQSAWKALAQAPLPILVGGVLLILTQGSGGGARVPLDFQEQGNGVNWSEIRPWILPLIGVVACVGIALFLFSSWIMVGLPNTVESVLRTGRADVGQVFDSKGRFGSMVLSRLLCVLIEIGAALPFVLLVLAIAILTKGFHRHEGLLLLLIPGVVVWLPVFLYVTLGISLADQAVALEGAQPVESVKRSWALVHGHRWMLLLYLIVGGIFSLLGLCLCCIGIFLTGTLFHVARSESYLALVRGSERASWWIEKGSAHPITPPEGWGAPPPPAAPPAPV